MPELHIRTSEFVREAAEGTVLRIERRGEPVAELRPISRKSTTRQLPDLSRVWRRFPQVAGDSSRFFEEDR